MFKENACLFFLSIYILRKRDVKMLRCQFNARVGVLYFLSHCLVCKALQCPLSINCMNCLG